MYPMKKKGFPLKRQFAALTAALALVLSLAACSSGSTSGTGSGSSSGSRTAPAGDGEEHALVLSDGTSTLDGDALTDSGSVTLTHDIVYYEDRDTWDDGSAYGEGTEADRHSAEEAESHTVVTIREPGTYRVSGTLNPGQLAVDLGEDARDNPDAAVTLILDGIDITSTVAPAVIFYQVYECDRDWVEYDQAEDGAKPDYTPSAGVDTSAAGARVILADGSENMVNGSYVARIYKEGTDSKLHKYDGAFYSKRSMVIDGEEEDSGLLCIDAANEGLDSELHLTVNGGTIQIKAENDGINANEDGVSAVKVSGGTLQISSGQGAEGDGIDSNGFLVIDGGSVYTLASDHSPDGGLDADGDILLNGGFTVAAGIRNDAVSADSSQQFMELSFASTLPAGSQVELSGSDGNALLSFTTEKACQSLTFSSPDLQKDTPYTLKVNGTVQQYTGNQSGGFGGGPGGMGGRDFQNGEQPPELPDGQMPEVVPGDQTPPDGQTPPDMPEGQTPPEGMTPPDGERPQRPEGADGQRPERPEGWQPQTGTAAAPAGEGSTEFTLTDTIHSFSGIGDSAEASGKTKVSFTASVSVAEDGTVTVSDIAADQDVDPAQVQISIADVPSENYAASCLWSDGEEALAGILPEDPGTYMLTISVTENETYAGTSQFQFVIPETDADTSG